MNGMGLPASIGMALGTVARAAVREAEPLIAVPAAMPPAYADLLGIYAEQDLFGETVRVEWRDGTLAVISPDSPPAVLLPTEDADLFAVKEGSRSSGEPTRFDRTEDGRVRRMWIGGGSYARLHPLD